MMPNVRGSKLNGRRHARQSKRADELGRRAGKGCQERRPRAPAREEAACGAARCVSEAEGAHHAAELSLASPGLSTDGGIAKQGV